MIFYYCYDYYFYYSHSHCSFYHHCPKTSTKYFVFSSFIVISMIIRLCDKILILCIRNNLHIFHNTIILIIFNVASCHYITSIAMKRLKPHQLHAPNVELYCHLLYFYLILLMALINYLFVLLLLLLAWFIVKQSVMMLKMMCQHHNMMALQQQTTMLAFLMDIMLKMIVFRRING